MKKYFLTLFSIVFFSSAIYAQLSKKFEPIDVFDIEYVSSPEISPQGDKERGMNPTSLSAKVVQSSIDESRF